MVRSTAATVAAREEVRRALTGHRRDIGSTLFQLGLLLTLILALAILLVLLGQVVSKALPVLQDRGGRSSPRRTPRWPNVQACDTGSSARCI